jgi:predicted RNase H-like HicB family nuclease
MRQITIRYHRDNQWWADSPDVPNYTAVADSFAELRDLVFDGIDFVVGEPVSIVEETAVNAAPLSDGASTQKSESEDAT